MTTLEKARKLSEQLRPAFAGYLTDGNISDRDVLATLLDLVVRNSVSLDMELEGERYKINKIMRAVGTAESLLPFERLFLNELFCRSNEITLEEFRKIAKSGKLHKIIENNLGVLKDFEIIDAELEFIENGHTISVSMNGKEVRTLEDMKKLNRFLKFILGFFILVPSFVFVSWIYGVMKSPNSSLHAPLPIIGACATYVLVMGLPILIYRKFEKSEKVLKLDLTSVPKTKKKYEELFKFIRKYPIKQQSLANEFMPFAVAFGLDTSWIKSFGMTREFVVSSKKMASEQ